MSNTVCVDGTFQYTFFLAIKLNITIVTSYDSLMQQDLHNRPSTLILAYEFIGFNAT